MIVVGLVGYYYNGFCVFYVYEIILFLLSYAILYVLIHQIIFRFYLLKYTLFFQVLLY